MKVWIDDLRPMPEGYDFWLKSVNEVKNFIENSKQRTNIELIDLDHDAGNYANDGGDYIKILDWFEEIGYNCPIHIHSMNPVGVQNMRAIIRRNGWKEII